jgi:hypothetical protein
MAAAGSPAVGNPLDGVPLSIRKKLAREPASTPKTWSCSRTGSGARARYAQSFRRNAGGTIERCDPPRSFAATWEFGDETTWIEVRLSEQPGGRIRFELEHVAHVADERWAQFGPGAVGVGWDLALVGLARHMSGAEPMDPQQGAAWAGSDEGREFISLSSEQWRQASVTAGTPAAEAQAAAARTTAFYTGAEPMPGS